VSATVDGRRVLSAQRTARYLGISIASFNKARSDDKEPRVPQPIDVRGVRGWVVEELDEFIARCMRRRA
jgi:predicted DNA-binding transcriptional regulator AlpA